MISRIILELQSFVDYTVQEVQKLKNIVDYMISILNARVQNCFTICFPKQELPLEAPKIHIQNKDEEEKIVEEIKSNNQQNAINELDEQVRKHLLSVLSKIPSPDNLSKQDELEQALSSGIDVLQNIFTTDNSLLSRKAWDECAKLEFEIYEKIAQINKKLKKQNPDSKILSQFDSFIQNVPAYKEIIALKGLLKEGWRFGVATNRFKENLLGVTVEALYDSYKNRQSDVQAWNTAWSSVRERIFTAAQEWRSIQCDKELSSKKITWLTGSSSASLIPIFKKAIDGKPALIPTGQLLRHNIVPLTGEIFFGLTRVNRNHLSGVTLADHEGALRYAEMARTSFRYQANDECEQIKNICDNFKKGIYDYSLMRLTIAAIRLGWSGVDGGMKSEALDVLKKGADSLPISDDVQKSDRWEKHIDLLGVQVPSEEALKLSHNTTDFNFIPGEIVLVPGSNEDYSIALIQNVGDENDAHLLLDQEGTTKWVDKKDMIYPSNEALESLKKNENKAVSDECRGEIRRSFESPRKKIERIIHLLGTTEKLELSEDEKELLEQPTGILWGSLTKQKKELVRVHSDIRGEKAIKGAQELGKDIQVLFAEPESLDRVKSFVEKNIPKEQKIHVMSTRVIPFLHAHQLHHNEYGSHKV